MLEIDHGTREVGSEWKFKLEGKLDNGLSEEQILSDKCNYFRFLSFFERVEIEFPGNESIY